MPSNFIAANMTPSAANLDTKVSIISIDKVIMSII